MSNGIDYRQNEDLSLAKLAAQRQLYSEAGRLDVLNSIISVILPFIFSFLVTVKTAGSGIRMTSYLLTIAALISSIVITKAIKKKKELAASIQLEFDVHVYNMPWDTKAFGKRKNNDAEIIEKSKAILSNEAEKNKLRNWYQPAADNLPLLDGILACQRENCHWDVGLRKRYRLCQIIIVIVISAIIVISGLINNDPFRDFFARIIFIIPMLRWLISSLNSISSDIERLQDLSREINSIDTKDMNDLQCIQKGITDHRQSAVKIPDFIYHVFQSSDEDVEKRILDYNERTNRK